ASLEFRGLRLVTTEEDKTLGRKVKRLQLARQLKSEEEIARNAELTGNTGNSGNTGITGIIKKLEAPKNAHPRLLLHGERLAHLRFVAKENETFREDENFIADYEDQYGGTLINEIRAYRHFLTLAEQARREIDAENPFAKVFNYEKNASVTDHRNRGRFEGTLHPIVTQLETLAAAAVIEENGDYGRHAARALVNMARTLDVNSPEIDQGFYYTRTFYVRTLAFGYDWLYKWLTPEERREVKVTLLGFIQDIYGRSWTNGWGQHPLHRVWNWNPGLVSCAGLGVLALQGETWTEEEAMLVQFRRHLRDYLTFGIDFDGCCHEGPAYLAYGVGAGVQFTECLREKGYGDLFTETNWQLIAPWLVSEMLPNKPMWNNLSDCSHGAPAGYPIYAYTCGRLAELAENDPVRPEDQEADFPLIQEEPLDYLQHFQESPGEKRLSYGAYAQLMQWAWRAGKETPPDVTTFNHAGILAYLFFYQPYTPAKDPGKYLPQSLFFRGRGLVVAREHGYGQDAFHLAIEAGPHASGHDQSDKGTFTFRAYGQDFIIDSGYGNDGEKMKSGSSFAHNVVLIDGEGQPMDWHNNSHGEITGFHRRRSMFDWIRVDARDAWNVTFSRLKNVPTGKNVAKAERNYIFMHDMGRGEEPYLVIFDDFRMADGKKHDFTWQLHTSADFDFDTTQKPWIIRQKQNDFQVLTSAKEERPGTAHGRAYFTLTAPKDGKFALVGVTRCGGEIRDKSDSFFIKVNDGPTLTWDLIPSGVFAFCRVSDRVTGDIILDLKAGETVRVTLWAREPEAEIAFLGLREAEDKNAKNMKN
ncbi:MAG: heparinase II/III family protein, partial [Planctomycetia bacterium]|nr:heparinase II/III family protein [Planctomycetia bacterium]